MRCLIQRYRDGDTAKELAAAFGIGITSVKRLLKEHDAEHTPKLTAAQVQTVFACYRAGIGPRELARRYGVTDRTIKYLLQKHGVQGQRGKGVTEGSA